jgi:hypothetical protein
MNSFLRTILPAFIALIVCVANVEAAKRKKKAPKDSFGLGGGIMSCLPMLAGVGVFYAIWLFVQNINATEDAAIAKKNRPKSSKALKAAARKSA